MKIRRFLTLALMLVALSGIAALTWNPPVQAAGCSCPKGSVCCFNCNGTFAYCARSHAYCPECPAP